MEKFETIHVEAQSRNVDKVLKEYNAQGWRLVNSVGWPMGNAMSGMFHLFFERKLAL